MKSNTILIGRMVSRLFYVMGVATVVFFCWAASAAILAAPLPEPAVPALSASQRAFLSRLARRAMRDEVLGLGGYEPGYVPAALASMRVEVVVRLRQRGYLLSSAAGGLAPVALATRDAALGAVQILGEHQKVDLGLLNRLLVEIEVVGPAQAIPSETDWTQPRAMDPFVEPGRDGIVLIGEKNRDRFCPSEIYTSDLTVADALQRIAEKVLPDPSRVATTKLLRFRTVHWYEAYGGAAIVSLQRGLTILPPGVVSKRGLDDAIARLAQYLAYRQKRSGLFSYQYEPAHDRYSEEDNLVRQVGATLAMAIHARWSGKSASLSAADVGIRYHLQGLTDIAGREGAAYIATADKRNKLGVTALVAIALAEHPEADRYEAVRRKLIGGMLWLQRPSGMFITAFPPAQQIDAQDYFPGEALLAMAKEYAHEPSSGILDAFDRAMSFYRRYFRKAPSPAFVPWQVQAYAAMADHGRRKDFVHYVFELTDWLAAKQLTPDHCRWPEMWGGIAAYQPGRAGVATASYLEGFADALALARDVGDEARARRYEKLVRGAARFVMQLQVRPEEAYFVRSPQDAIGGVRTAPALDLLRIDHVQHALVGLIKTRKVLFADEG